MEVAVITVECSLQVGGYIACWQYTILHPQIIHFIQKLSYALKQKVYSKKINLLLNADERDLEHQIPCTMNL